MKARMGRKDKSHHGEGFAEPCHELVSGLVSAIFAAIAKGTLSGAGVSTKCKPKPIMTQLMSGSFYVLYNLYKTLYICSNMSTPLPVRTARSGWAFSFYAHG